MRFTLEHDSLRAWRSAVAFIGFFGIALAAEANEYFPRFSVETLVERNSHSTVTVGPDGHLYTTTTNSGGREPRDNGAGKMVKEHLGEVWRYELHPESGHVLSEQRLVTMSGPVNGLVFDPSATPRNLLFYITVLNDRGHLNRLRVKPLGETEPLIENTIVLDHLGRGGNHGMNNLAFGPDGKLYANQGGRTFWGTEEDDQSAAVLVIDLTHPNFENGPVSPRDYTLQQMWGGSAPIQLFATGLRNPHGIVRHSNGNYYVTIHDPPRGPLLVGGPIQEEVVSDGPPDLVARLKQGAYYGHANPNRQEWVSYGGNPTEEVDPFEIPEYPVGTMPLPNYDLTLMLGTRRNHCISGIDEYLNGDLIAGYLYAQGAEGVNRAGIERFQLDDEGNFTGFHEFLKGEDNRPLVFNGVMDVEVTPQGWVYVANFGRRKGDGGLNGSIDLLKPLGGNIPPAIVVQSPENRSVFKTGESIAFQIDARDYDGDVSRVTLIVNGKERSLERSAIAESVWKGTWAHSRAGRYEVRARAVDDQGADAISSPVYLQVNPQVRPPVVTARPQVEAFVNTPYRSLIHAVGHPPVRYSLVSGPPGLSVESDTGWVDWLPSVAGTFPIEIAVENGVEPAVVDRLELTVAKARTPEFDTGSQDQLVPGVEFHTAQASQAAGPSTMPGGRTREYGTLDGFTGRPASGASIVYFGFIEVPDSGNYEFAVPLRVDAELAIGRHHILDGKSLQAGRIPLQAGMHAFTLRVAGSQEVSEPLLRIRGPNDSAAHPVPAAALFRNASAYGLDAYAGAQPYLRMPRDDRDFLPATLSETGVYADVASMTLASGAIPYRVNSPLWSDGAHKQRWVFIPKGKLVGFRKQGAWSVPSGSVFVKHFALGDERKRVETRLTVVTQDQTLYGVTYRWRENNEDADLVTASVEDEIEFDDGTRQRWFYPGPGDCMQCHTHASGYVLGFNTRQLNGTNYYAETGKRDNQLRTLNHVGMFDGPLEEESIPALDRLVALNDQGAPLEKRVRSYLDSNCAQCHTVGGVNANWLANYDDALDDLGVLDAKPLNHMGLADVKLVAPGEPENSVMLLRVTTDKRGYRMPPIGRLKTDVMAVSALEQWIDRLHPRANHNTK